jgi:hypothetical protein
MRLVLKKVETSAQERTTARTLQPELRLPDDTVAAGLMYRATATPAAAPTPSARLAA